MAYNIAIRMKHVPASKIADIIIWCHEHMCMDKDWAMSDEWTEIHGIEILTPEYLWLNNEDDLLAMTLALGLQFDHDTSVG